MGRHPYTCTGKKHQPILWTQGEPHFDIVHQPEMSSGTMSEITNDTNIYIVSRSLINVLFMYICVELQLKMVYHLKPPKTSGYILLLRVCYGPTVHC